jgi:hypothetical protein
MQRGRIGSRERPLGNVASDATAVRFGTSTVFCAALLTAGPAAANSPLNGRQLFHQVLRRTLQQPRVQVLVEQNGLGFPSPLSWHIRYRYVPPQRLEYDANGQVPWDPTGPRPRGLKPFQITVGTSSCQADVAPHVWGCSDRTGTERLAAGIRASLLPPAPPRTEHASYDVKAGKRQTTITIRAHGDPQFCYQGLGRCSAAAWKASEPYAVFTMAVVIDSRSQLLLSISSWVQSKPGAHANPYEKVYVTYPRTMPVVLPAGPRVACPAVSAPSPWQWCISDAGAAVVSSEHVRQ